MSQAQNPSASSSLWTPFRYPLYRAMWTASLISSIGSWMQDMGMGWLMTQLTHSSLHVALIQTATLLPFFFLALPAGILADMVNRRRYLLVTVLSMVISAVLMGLLTLGGWITPGSMLALAACLGIANAMMRPAWAAVSPSFVPRDQLRQAMTLNAMTMDASRAIGPALAGLVILALGPGPVFLINGLTFVVLAVTIWRWREAPPSAPTTLPVERFFESMRVGLRYARHEPGLRASLVKGMSFIAFGSVSWALMPVLGIRELGLDPHSYGLFAAGIGIGAVAGGLLMPRLQKRYSRNNIVVRAAAIYAVTLVGLVLTRNLLLVEAALIVGGGAWLCIFSSLLIVAQHSVPDWIRARALALVMLSLFGTLAIASAGWGRLADQIGVRETFLVAAAGVALSLYFTRRVHLRNDDHTDHMVTAQFPLPEYADEIEKDSGPVMVRIGYRIAAGDQAEFYRLMQDMRRIRLRDGAYFWEIFLDPDHPGHLIEVFVVNSWLDRLRQQQRATLADQNLRRQIRALHQGPEPPTVDYLISSSGIAGETVRKPATVNEI